MHEKSCRKGTGEEVFKPYHNPWKVGVLEKGVADRVNCVQWKYDLCLIRSVQWFSRETHSWWWSSSGFTHCIVGSAGSEVSKKSTASPFIVTESLQHPPERVHSSWIWRQCVLQKSRADKANYTVCQQRAKIIRTIILGLHQHYCDLNSIELVYFHAKYFLPRTVHLKLPKSKDYFVKYLNIVNLYH
jgi:hypothetical protein